MMLLTDVLPDHQDRTAQDPAELYDRFTQWVGSRGITLYPAQDQAVTELLESKNVIMATPTGSGKSMVALATHFLSLAQHQVSYYTAPIKALVSEKFFDLVDIFGAENVGMITGDASVNAQAPIICCTAEILANVALREGTGLDIGQVIMDEFHYYADPARGWAWQVPLIELPQAQFLLMSATLGDTTRFEQRLTEATGKPTVTVTAATRPIPLHFSYSEQSVVHRAEQLVAADQAPIYIVHFSQLDAVEQASNLSSLAVLSKAEQAQLAEQLETFPFQAGFGKTLKRLLKAGIGVHHAGMLPKYRRLVEKLAQQGTLKIICGTDTLGVGINVPIRTVLITALSKFDGRKTRHLNAREFHQIAGRAGRAGFDTAGYVVVQAPEHVIENQAEQAKLEQKFAGIKDPQERARRIKQSSKSSAKKKPPEGFVSWSEKTFDKLVAAEPEPMVSQLRINHSMVLNLVERVGNPVRHVRRLITRSDETPARQAQLQREAIGILRELLATGVLVKSDTPDEFGRQLEITVDLQPDFALNQPLSPFALAAFELLDPDSPTYALDMVSIVEATLDSPRQILSAQTKKAKDEKMAEMKAEGLEYTERMNILDQTTYPQPLGELLEQQFAVYAQAAPWLKDFELEPKSVVRDMYERAMSFGEFVSFYSLARSEGVVLRYLTDAAKAMRQTIPQDVRTAEIEMIQDWLDTMIRFTDSSLLEEWEDLIAGDIDQAREEYENPEPPSPPKLTEQTGVFRVMIRNAMFRRVQLFGAEKDAELEGMDYLPEGAIPFTSDNWADALDDFFADYEDLDDTASARDPKLLRINTEPQLGPGELDDLGASPGDYWNITQVLVDPEANYDWALNAVVHLAASNEQGAPAITMLSVGEPIEG